MSYESTGSRNQQLGNRLSVRDIFKDSKMRLFSGAIPANADAAETGTLIAIITTGGATAKVKQKITITPVIGDAAGAVWSVTLNGITVSVTDDGTPTVAEVCTLLANALKTINGTAITTPPCDLSIPAVEGLFTITDNTTDVTVEAVTAGVSFEYSSTVTGATTATLTSVLTTDNAYGLRFEVYGDIAGGILDKLATDTWKGTALVPGTITYGRLVQDGDTGVLSTTEPRMQGLVAAANAEIIVSHVDVVVNETVEVTSFNIYMDASA